MARLPRKLAGIGASDLSDNAEFDAYVGPAREITVDHVRGIIALHDGVTPGGKRFLIGGGIGINPAAKSFAGIAGDNKTYTLDVAPQTAANVIVFIGGSPQSPTTDYTVNGTTLNIISNPDGLEVSTLVLAGPFALSTLQGKVASDFLQTGETAANFIIMKRSQLSTVLLNLKDRLDKEFAPLTEWTGNISDPNDTAAYTTKMAAAFEEVKDKGLFIPPGRYPFSTLTWPNIERFSVIGAGNGSILVQRGAGIKFPFRATTNLNAHGLISNLTFEAHDGTGPTIDTTYAQTMELVDLSWSRAVKGFSCIKVNGNPNDGTYMHDVRIMRPRLYHHTEGYLPAGPASEPHPLAFIELGGFVADSEIVEAIAEGAKDLDYIILARDGAQTTRIALSHIYNVRKNALRMEGNNGDFDITFNTFDYCDEDNVRVIGGAKNSFNGNFFQFTKTGYSGLLLDGSYRNGGTGNRFSSELGDAVAAIREINGSAGNAFSVGILDDYTRFANVFQMSGVGSYATGYEGDTPMGNHGYLEKVVSAPINRNTAVALGQNGATAGAVNTAWRKISPGRVLSAYVVVDTAPTVAQVFNVKRNNTIIGTITIAPGQFSGSVRIIPDAQFWGTGGATLYIEYVGSSEGGTFNPSYGLEIVE